MELDDSYYNWILRYDLHCASGTKIGLIGAVPFIGWVSTLLFLPRLSDALWGRQKMMIVGYLITLLAYTTLVISTTYTLLIASLFVIGAMATIRVQVSVIYLYETLTRNDYRRVYTALAMFEGVAGVISTLYFRIVSKDSTGLIIIAYVMMLLGVIAAFMYPESPRYLVKTDQIERAQEVFSMIAQWNKKPTVSKQELEEIFAIKSEN